MDAHFDGAVEDVLVAGNGEAADVDVELSTDEIAQIVNHALAIDAAYFNGGIEEQLLVHLPFGIEDSIAETRLQT